MQDFRQRVIQLYPTREQLIQQGIWDGKLYSQGDSTPGNGANNTTIDIDSNDRAWVWRTLLLNPEDDAVEGQRFITQDTILSSALSTLIPVPMMSSGSNDESQGESIVPRNTVLRPLKALGNGIRKLTPRETSVHPLDAPEVDDANNGSDAGMSLADTLEIIDLDLSRLMLSDIFQEPHVHALMRKLMFNYLLLENKHSSSAVSMPADKQTYHYRQGYHETLGVIFLQFSSSSTPMTDENIRFVLFIFAKLMQPLAHHFYNEQNLLHWEEHTFSRMLRLASPQLYAAFYPAAGMPHNLIWLIRGTRLLFLRELTMQQTLVVWDHALTFTYPVKTFVAAVIVSILASQRRELVATLQENEDSDDLIEYMLQFGRDEGERSGKQLDIVGICGLARKLCDAWECGQFKELRHSCDAYVQRVEMDPNRQRLEDRLRQRVRKSLAGGQ